MFKSHKHCLAQWPDCISKTNLLFVTALRRYVKSTIIKKKTQTFALVCGLLFAFCTHPSAYPVAYPSGEGGREPRFGKV